MKHTQTIALFRRRDALLAQLAAVDRQIATAHQQHMLTQRTWGLRLESFRKLVEGGQSHPPHSPAPAKAGVTPALSRGPANTQTHEARA